MEKNKSVYFKAPLDQELLRSGILVATGAYDRQGRLLLTFPSAKFATIERQYAASHILRLLQTYLPLLNHRGNPHNLAFLADFRNASKDVTAALILTLEQAQSEHNGVVGAFYIIQPKQKDVLKFVRKMLGLKVSKKHPKLPAFESVLLADQSELLNHVNANQLTKELGGTFKYSHEAWIIFLKRVNELKQTITAALDKVPEARDKLQMLQEYDSQLPEELLTQIRSKYHDIMRELNLEHTIDECGELLQHMSSPDSHPAYAYICHTVTFKHAKDTIEGHRKRLVKIREQLKALWQMAEERVLSISRVGRYKTKADKVLEWIKDVGLPAVNQSPEIADCLSQAEILKCHFETGFLTVAQNVISLAERIQKKLEKVILEDRSPNHTGKKSYREEFVASITYFRQRVQKKHQVYLNVHKFFLNAVKTPSGHNNPTLDIYKHLNQVVQWYQKVLGFLPIQLLHSPMMTAPGTSARVYVSRAWSVATENFLILHPPPGQDHLVRLQNVIPVLDNVSVRNQARLLIHRVIHLRKLLIAPDTVMLPEFRDILHWKDQLRSSGEFHFTLDAYPGDGGESVSSSNAEMSDSADTHKSLMRRAAYLQQFKAPRSNTFTHFDTTLRAPKPRLHTQRHGLVSSALPSDVTLEVVAEPVWVLPFGPDSSESSSSNTSRGNRMPTRQIFYVNERPRPSLKSTPQNSPHLPTTHIGHRNSSYTTPHGEDSTDNGQLAAGAPSSASSSSPLLNNEWTIMRTPKLRFKGISDHSNGGPVVWEHQERPGSHSQSPWQPDDDSHITWPTGRLDSSHGPPSLQPTSFIPSQQTDMSQTKLEERYISLGLHAGAQSEKLPKSLEHIDISALQKNVPQHAKKAQEAQTTKSQSYESLVDSGIVGNRESITETSNSTMEISPHHAASPSQENMAHVPGQGTFRYRQDSVVSRSLPDLATQMRTISLNQDNIDSVVKSNLTPEEKLNLMASMCDCSEDDPIPTNPWADYGHKHTASQPYQAHTPSSHTQHRAQSKSEEYLPRKSRTNVERKWSKSSHPSASSKSKHRPDKAYPSTYHSKAPDQASSHSSNLTEPDRLPLMDLAAVDVAGKAEHYGIDIQEWMRDQEVETASLRDSSDLDLQEANEEDLKKWKAAKQQRRSEELELEQAQQDLESLLVAQEEIMQNDVETSLLRTERLLKEQEELLEEDVFPAALVTATAGTSNSPQEQPVVAGSLEHGSAHAQQVGQEDSLSEESGIFTQASHGSRIRSSDVSTDSPRMVSHSNSMDSPKFDLQPKSFYSKFSPRQLDFRDLFNKPHDYDEYCSHWNNEPYENHENKKVGLECITVSLPTQQDVNENEISEEAIQPKMAEGTQKLVEDIETRLEQLKPQLAGSEGPDRNSTPTINEDGKKTSHVRSLPVIETQNPENHYSHISDHVTKHSAKEAKIESILQKYGFSKSVKKGQIINAEPVGVENSMSPRQMSDLKSDKSWRPSCDLETHKSRNDDGSVHLTSISSSSSSSSLVEPVTVQDKGAKHTENLVGSLLSQMDNKRHKSESEADSTNTAVEQTFRSTPSSICNTLPMEKGHSSVEVLEVIPQVTDNLPKVMETMKGSLNCPI